MTYSKLAIRTMTNEADAVQSEIIYQQVMNRTYKPKEEEKTRLAYERFMKSVEEQAKLLSQTLTKNTSETKQ